MAARREPLRLYRKSEIGISLTETLDELIGRYNLPEELAFKVMAQFDQSISDALAQRARTKVNAHGQLNTYRFCDNVWTFIVENATFRTDTENIQTDIVKIVSCDGTRA